MMKQAATLLATVSLCLVAGCNRGSGNNASGASANVSSAAAPAAKASGNSATPVAAQARLALTPSGLEAIAANGQRSPLNFGSPLAEAIQALTGMIGAPSGWDAYVACGSGADRIEHWSNGLRIISQNGRVVGWEVEQPGLYALGDLQVGMTRVALEANQASFEQTTLGSQWTVGDGDQTVSGLLGEDGKVTRMWAGLTCHMT